MQLKQLQQKTSSVFINNLKRDKIKLDADYLSLKLSEEVGEFIQSYLICKKRCRPAKYLKPQEAKRELAKELSDVLGLVFVLAKELNINVEEALVKKWITREWLNPHNT